MKPYFHLGQLIIWVIYTILVISVTKRVKKRAEAASSQRASSQKASASEHGASSRQGASSQADKRNSRSKEEEAARRRDRADRGGVVRVDGDDLGP